MKHLLIVLPLLCLLSPLAHAQLKSAKDAEKLLKERQTIALNEKEKRITGKFTGKNHALSWEIHRKEDGTYEMVFREKVDGVVQEDFVSGIWGITGDRYYYMDLRSTLAGIADAKPYKVWETVDKVDKDQFVTKSKDDDGKDLVSPEKRVKTFRLALWKALK